MLKNITENYLVAVKYDIQIQTQTKKQKKKSKLFPLRKN
jgi:hypothetical protein